MADSPLADYLTKLHTDPEELRKYKESPETAMEAAGLPHEKRQILLRENPKELSLAVSEELGTEVSYGGNVVRGGNVVTKCLLPKEM